MAIGQKSQEYEIAKIDGRLQKYFDALRGGITRRSAMAYAGIAERTVYERIAKNESFRREVEDSEEYWIAIVENAKRKKIVDEGYWPAIEKELRSRRREIYGDNIQISGDPLNPILIDVTNKTLLELEAMRKQYL